jgi:DNA-binding YbaB/EbfC family protein
MGHEQMSKEKLEKIQKQFYEHLSQVEVKGVAGSANPTTNRYDIEVLLDGTHKVCSIHIDPKWLTPENKAVLEELITAAINDASKKLVETIKTKTNEFLANMGELE